jgi:hypothetical protein
MQWTMNLPDRVLNWFKRLLYRFWWCFLSVVLSTLYKPIQWLANWLKGHRNGARSRHNSYKSLPPGFDPRTGRLRNP